MLSVHTNPVVNPMMEVIEAWDTAQVDFYRERELP